MLILRRTLCYAVIGAVVSYVMFLALFLAVGVAHDLAPSLLPSGFLLILTGIGALVGGAMGVESGVIEADRRKAAMRRHPASPSRATTYHASNQWGR